MASPIVVWAHLDERGRDHIRTTLRNEPLHFANPHAPRAADREVLQEAEIVFGNVPAALLPTCSRLRWMQLESVGFEYYQKIRPASGVRISNLKGMFDKPAAETALAGILALTRGLRRLIPAQADCHWIELEVRPETWILHGKRAVVLGAGTLGRRMRRLLEAFECDVKSFARTSPDATLRTLAELKAQVAVSDIVVCCLPKTPETIGLVNREILEAMGPAGIFVNIGRGAVVDEAALTDLLRQRRLGGAVIDVTLAEPLPPDHPLWRCPNTILTQHTGGGYVDELLDKARFFLKNLQRFRANDPSLETVDLQRGY